MLIQLQPQSANLDAWAQLALQENAAFEVMEIPLVSGICDAGERRILTEKYRKTGLAASLHGAFIDANPASGDPNFRELSRQRCRESCEIASALGAGNLIFHSSAFPFLRGAYLENWAAGCAFFYEELAEQYPVKIFIENAQDLDPLPLRKLMERISSDRVGICLDIGHIHYSRAPVSRWFGELGQWVQYLHLSDNLGEFDDHLALGQGTVDWELVNRLWKALDREVPITLETGDLESARESLRFLHAHQYFGL